MLTQAEFAGFMERCAQQGRPVTQVDEAACPFCGKHARYVSFETDGRKLRRKNLTLRCEFVDNKGCGRFFHYRREA